MSENGIILLICNAPDIAIIKRINASAEKQVKDMKRKCMTEEKRAKPNKKVQPY